VVPLITTETPSSGLFFESVTLPVTLIGGMFLVKPAMLVDLACTSGTRADRESTPITAQRSNPRPPVRSFGFFFIWQLLFGYINKHYNGNRF
jgi:hypothetical protein